MSETLQPNPETMKTAQELHEAVNDPRVHTAGDYNGNLQFSHGNLSSTSGFLKDGAVVDYRFSAKRDGSAGREIRVKFADSEDEYGRSVGTTYTTKQRVISETGEIISNPGSVAVDRKDGTQVELTGKRAERATQILMGRAARLISEDNNRR